MQHPNLVCFKSRIRIRIHINEKPYMQCWGSERFFSESDSDPVFRPIRIRIRLLTAPDPNPNAFGFGSESKSTLKTKSNSKISEFFLTISTKWQQCLVFWYQSYSLVSMVTFLMKIYSEFQIHCFFSQKTSKNVDFTLLNMFAYIKFAFASFRIRIRIQMV